MDLQNIRERLTSFTEHSHKARKKAEAASRAAVRDDTSVGGHGDIGDEGEDPLGQQKEVFDESDMLKEAVMLSGLNLFPMKNT